MTKPYPFQTEDAGRIDTFKGRCLLAHEMGSGKSLISLLWAKNHPDVRPIVIVCPASLKWNWQAECRKHFGLRSEILEGRKIPAEGLSQRAGILILNYDILPQWLTFLRELGPQLVIYDEAHYTKSRTALRTKSLRKLCEGVPHVLALSGTPLTNRPAELWPTLNILRPDLYPSFFSFAQNHCSPRRTPWGWDFRGAARLPQLHRSLTQNLMIRRRKVDVLSQLPSKTRSVILLDIENRKEYNHAFKDLLSWLRKEKKNTMGARKAEKLVKVGHLKRLAAKLKLTSVTDWVDSFLEETEGKLILFGIHHAIVDALHERYRKQSVLVTGDVTGRNRQKAIDQFTNDKRTRLFVGNIHAAGVGWNGTAASTVAFCELDWVPGNHTQAEDRCHRIGTKNAVSIHYLVARRTIEEDLVELLTKKQKVLDQTLDGKRNASQFDLIDALLEEISKRGKIQGDDVE